MLESWSMQYLVPTITETYGLRWFGPVWSLPARAASQR